MVSFYSNYVKLIFLPNTIAVVSTLLNFVRMFNKAHEENCKQNELEMKKAAETDKSKLNDSHKKADHQLQTSLLTSNVL